MTGHGTSSTMPILKMAESSGWGAACCQVLGTGAVLLVEGVCADWQGFWFSGLLTLDLGFDDHGIGLHLGLEFGGFLIF